MEQNHTTQTKKLTGTQENVIVGAVAVLLTVFLFVFVGWDGLKNWFSTPLIWHDPDYITVEALSKEETDDEIQLLIYAVNEFHRPITSYHLEMDKAFADMIAANNSQAKKEYQKWAQHKANAEMCGNQHDAAFAQRQMDRYMADMLQGK